jgi:hypothetical protein
MAPIHPSGHGPASPPMPPSDSLERRLEIAIHAEILSDTHKGGTSHPLDLAFEDLEYVGKIYVHPSPSVGPPKLSPSPSPRPPCGMQFIVGTVVGGTVVLGGRDGLVVAGDWRLVVGGVRVAF